LFCAYRIVGSLDFGIGAEHRMLKRRQAAFADWLIVFLSPFVVLAVSGAIWNARSVIRANRYSELGLHSLVAANYRDQILRDVMFTLVSASGLFVLVWSVSRFRPLKFLPYAAVLQLCLTVSRVLYPAHWFASFHLGWLSLPGFVWQRQTVARFGAAAVLGLAFVWVVRKLRGYPPASAQLPPRRLVTASAAIAGGAGLVAASVVIGTAARVGAEVRPERPYHIIWIALDSVRADFVSGYGYPARTTPHIDAFAAAGVVFENAYSQGNWTYPSFASMLSSRYLSELPGGRLGPEVITAAELFRSAGYDTAAYVQNPNLDVEFLFHQGFASYNEFLVREGPEPLITKACARLNDMVSDDFPSFVLVHVQGAHYPYRRDNPFLREFLQEFTPEEIERANQLLIDNARSDRYRATAEGNQLRKRIEAVYAAALRETDEAVGRMLKEIGRLRLLDRSVVVISSDHGEEFGLRGRFGHAGWHLYPELTRVPLILHLPARFGLAGRRVRTPVMNLDILPTLLAVVGLRPLVRLCGSNLIEIARRPVTRLAWSEAGDVVAVRDGRFALHADYRERSVLYEWYDLAVDPQELKPLAQPPVPDAAHLRTQSDSRYRRSRMLQYGKNADRRGITPELRERLRSLGYTQ
jgi:arylsulfatase A-like enzyme